MCRETFALCRLARLAMVLVCLLAPMSTRARGQAGAEPSAVSGNLEDSRTRQPLRGVEVRLFAGETPWSRGMRQLQGLPRPILGKATSDDLGAFRVVVPAPGPYAIELDVAAPQVAHVVNLLVVGEVELGTWPVLGGVVPAGRVVEGELALQPPEVQQEPWTLGDWLADPSELWGPQASLRGRLRAAMAPLAVGVPGRPPRRCDHHTCSAAGPEQVVELRVKTGQKPVGEVVVLGPEGWPYGVSDPAGRARVILPADLRSLELWTRDGRWARVDLPVPLQPKLEVDMPSAAGALAVELRGAPRPTVVASQTGWAVVEGGQRHQLPLGDSGSIRARAANGHGTAAKVFEGKARLFSSELGQCVLRIVESGGAPVPGTTVRFSQERSEDQPPLELWRRVDETGRLVVRGLERSVGGGLVTPARVEVRAPGYSFVARDQACSTGAEGFELVRAARARLAVVRGDGQPIAGAEVEVVRADTNLAQGWTGSDGVAVFEVPMPGESQERWQVSVRAAGFAPLSLPGIDPVPLVEVRGDAGSEPARIDLGTAELDRGAEVEVVVTDEGGNPLSGVEITAGENALELLMAARGFGLRSRTPVFGTTTDAQGRARVGWFRQDAEVWLVATHDDRSPASGLARAGNDPAILVVGGTVAFAGRVIDADGMPVQDVQVVVSTIQSGTEVRASRPPAQARTDGAGRFRVDGVAPGPVGVAVEGAGWIPRMVVSEAPGEAEVVIELARAVTVRVEVVDVAGESIDGARVRVEAAERGQVPIARWGVTSSGGPAEVTGVRPGAAVIEVSSPGYSPKQAGATLRPGDVTDVRVVLEGGVRLAGRLVDEDGRPAAGRVGAFGLSWAENRQVGADGAFDFGLVAAGTVQLVASGGEFAVAREILDVREDRSDVELRVRRGARVEGRVIGLLPGEAEVARIAARGGSGLDRPGRVDWDGAFVLPGLDPAGYVLVATLPDGRSGEAAVTLSAGQTLAGVEIAIAAHQQVSGVVRSDGQPAAGVVVRARGGRSGPESTTDLAGRFELRLSDGHWVLTVMDARGTTGTWELDVAGSPVELDLEIQTSRLEVRVVDADGAPVSGARVGARSIDPGTVTHAQGLTGTDGRAVLHGGEGPWLVTVEGEGFDVVSRSHAGPEVLEIAIERRRVRHLRVRGEGTTPSLVWAHGMAGGRMPKAVILDGFGAGVVEGLGTEEHLVIAADGFAPTVVSGSGDELEVFLRERIPVLVDFDLQGQFVVEAVDEWGQPWIEVARWGPRYQQIVAGGSLDLARGTWTVRARGADAQGNAVVLVGRVTVVGPGQQLRLDPP